MKKTLLLAVGILALSACNQTEKPHYYLKATFEEKQNNKTAYIVDFDTENKIDSAVITNCVAEFNGEIPEARYVTLAIDNEKFGNFYLEADSIEMDAEGVVSGGELNKKVNDYWENRFALIQEFRNLPDSLQKSLYDSYSSRLEENEKKLLDENIDNALGYYEFLIGPARDMTIEQLDSAITAHPSLGKYQRIQKIKKRLLAEAETGEGAMFKDFEVTYNDSTFRLSDYVGKGKFVLVDFWASWCGPCIRQTAVIKDIYKEYGPKGLDVIGIAVWDEPENTIKGIAAHELPWRNIINAQDIPAEVYGFSGIPCIILFGPDGTIISRDKQNDALRQAVANAMDNTK